MDAAAQEVEAVAAAVEEEAQEEAEEETPAAPEGNSLSQPFHSGSFAQHVTRPAMNGQQ